MIKRKRLVETIRPFYRATDTVKVITGVRRSGKSALLSQIADELREGGVADRNIIHINFEHYKFTGHSELYKYIDSKVKKTGAYFVFMDEIQAVDGFEEVVNYLLEKENVSLFIAESGARPLSGEPAAPPSGRYARFFVPPFTLGETLRISGETDRKKAFENYMQWGGLPGHFVFENDADKRKYLQDVYNSVILRDILQPTGIRDLSLLENIIQFMINSTGSVFSANTISKFLKSQNRSVSAGALYNYVKHLTDSMLFNKINRVDIKSGSVLATLEKYYIADLGLLQVKRGFRDESLEARFETIIANELLARGYRIHVGVRRGSVIDFVAERNGETEFIQAAYAIDSDEALKRKLDAVSGIAGKKTLITREGRDCDAKSVRSVSATDWLLEINNAGR